MGFFADQVSPSITHRSCQCCRFLLPLHVLQCDKCLGFLVPLPLLPGMWALNGPVWPHCGCRGSWWLLHWCWMLHGTIVSWEWGGGGVSKALETRGFAGWKSEAVIFSSIVLLEALAIVFSSPWNSGQSQACDTLVTCALVPGCLHPGVGLSDGRGEVWSVVETWRVSSPGERVKEAQSLQGQSIWSSPRKRDRADLSLGRGFRKGHPQGRESESISPWGEGERGRGSVPREIVR